jgi:hypothetical protein
LRTPDSKLKEDEKKKRRRVRTANKQNRNVRGG